MDLAAEEGLQLAIDAIGRQSAPRKRRSSQHSDSEPAEHKRAKARERQRRKRERDRSGAGAALPGYPDHQNGADADPATDPGAPPEPAGPPMSAEEVAKKERVRIAARDRQRKHRAVVKAKRMAEMGLPMALDSAGQPVQYHPHPPDGYAHMHPHPAMHGADDPLAHHAHPHAHPHHPDLPFPITQPNHSPGQTFASIILLSLSCTPQLRAHLLSQTAMTLEELVSFEPILAAAWETWNQDRSMRYGAHADEHGAQGSPYAQPGALSGTHSPYAPEHAPLHADASAEFRSRFQRPAQAYAAPGAGAHPIDPALGSGEMLSVSDVRCKDEDDEDDDGAQQPEIDPELGDGGA